MGGHEGAGWSGQGERRDIRRLTLRAACRCGVEETVTGQGFDGESERVRIKETVYDILIIARSEIEGSFRGTAARRIVSGDQ